MATTQNIVLLGAGKVGREVIRQIQAAGLPIQFTAIADSQAILSGSPLTAAQISGLLEAKTNGRPLAELAGALPLDHLPHFYRKGTIVVDTTASHSLNLLPALQAGCKLVFANKNAHSGAWQEAAALYNNLHVRYEATVGAGLPTIQTLRSLLATGDQITRMEGVMSGTLGFLCSQLETGLTYSQAVRLAFESGFTEPDPRDDLSGFDVARKALILARTAGWPLEIKDLSIQPLYDASLAQVSVPEFFDQMSGMDAAYQKMAAEARQAGQVLRYVAVIQHNSAMIGLSRLDQRSPMGILQGPGNYFAFFSQRYREEPLVISGPGAGIALTAAGVFGDILALMT
jgi:homoserine dehydrogenase